MPSLLQPEQGSMSAAGGLSHVPAGREQVCD